MKQIPDIGLGTWRNTEPETCRKAVKNALELGYSHIDTAQHYHNEEHVGEGIKEANVDRDDFFLASKVWTDRLSREDVVKSTQESLEKLGVDRIDLMYVHYPAGDYDAEETLEGFKEIAEKGMVDGIGLSNFLPEQVDTAMKIAGEQVVANQVESHPLFFQEEVLENCRKHGIEMVAYSPLARGEVFNIPEIQEVAEKHGVSEAQVSLAWLLEKDVKVIPKASTEEHIRDNLEARQLSLDREDVKKIDSLKEKGRKVDPDYAPWNR